LAILPSATTGVILLQPEDNSQAGGSIHSLLPADVPEIEAAIKEIGAKLLRERDTDGRRQTGERAWA
jgi:hypothetical protein